MVLNPSRVYWPMGLICSHQLCDVVQHIHFVFKLAINSIRFWRIGFSLIARKARTRAAPSRVPRNEIIEPSDSSPSGGAAIFFPTVGAPSKNKNGGTPSASLNCSKRDAPTRFTPFSYF